MRKKPPVSRVKVVLGKQNALPPSVKNAAPAYQIYLLTPETVVLSLKYASSQKGRTTRALLVF